jgi:hypothetical protein
MKKMQFLFFYENYACKNFRIWPYATKIIFFVFENVLNFFKKYFGENWYFNTGFVFYSVNIQPDIMQNG